MAEQLMELWHIFADDPSSFIKKHLQNSSAIHRLNYDSLLPFYSSVRGFRLGHPWITFYRCWNCDRFSETEKAPLLPPQDYLHSTSNDKILLSRPDYSRYERKARELQSWQELLMERPPLEPWQKKYDNETWKSTNYQFVDGNYILIEKGQYESLRHERQELIAKVQKLISECQLELSTLTPRPAAETHRHCKECGTLFPFLLRPTTDTRYYRRPDNKCREALTAVEYLLWGDDSPLDIWVNMSGHKRHQAMLDYEFKKCGLSVNAFYIWFVELNDNYEWQWVWPQASEAASEPTRRNWLANARPVGRFQQKATMDRSRFCPEDGVWRDFSTEGLARFANWAATFKFEAYCVEGEDEEQFMGCCAALKAAGLALDKPTKERLRQYLGPEHRKEEFEAKVKMVSVALLGPL